MKLETIVKEFKKQRAGLWVPEPGWKRDVVDWVDDGEHDGSRAPLIDEVGFAQLLRVVPDKVATNLLKARDDRAGRGAMLKAGLGYEECVAVITADSTAIGTSSAEAMLIPANSINPNYLQPQGLIGRTLNIRARGRVTTLTTAATLTFRWGTALTNVVNTTRWAQSGAITMDATAQTNTMWRLDAGATVRGSGSAGSVFAMGDANVAAAAFTIANQQNQFMGSAGATAPAAVTVDLTVQQFLSLTAQWSLATAYSIQAHRYQLEVLN